MPDLPTDALPAEIDFERKDATYVWATCLTKLIASEAVCDWSLWFRARYRYEKLSAGFDFMRWTKEHDDLVRARAAKLLLKHVAPTLEHPLTVRGLTATISGKPDIQYTNSADKVFEGCKTDAQRDSDHV